MDLITLARSAVVFLIFATLLGTNLEDNLLARLGFGANYGQVFCVAAIFTALAFSRNAFIVAAIIVLGLNANMPADFTLNFGYDRDLYAGLMMALLIQPLIHRAMS